MQVSLASDKDMKTILKYAIPLIILAAIFLSGRYTASDNSDQQLEKGKQERQLLMDKVVEKQVEIAALTAKSKAQDQKIARLETAVEKGDAKIKTLEARSREKVAAVAKYTPMQRDSFFYAKYPGQDTIRNVDSRKVAVDLVRLEGMDSLNIALRQQNDTLKAEVAEQKERIATGEQKFEKQKEITSDFVRLSESWRKEAEYYQKRNQKSRLKTKILACLVIVLTGGLIVK